MAPLPAPAEKPSQRVSDSQSHAKVSLPAQVAVSCAAPWPNLQPALTQQTKDQCRSGTRAGLNNVRTHYLRHSYAGRALALGKSLPLIVAEAEINEILSCFGAALEDTRTMVRRRGASPDRMRQRSASMAPMNSATRPALITRRPEFTWLRLSRFS